MPSLAPGRLWVFHGTVAEDATAGTHVSSLIVTPGAGKECELQGGIIIVGATATAQTPICTLDDGVNLVQHLFNEAEQSNTVSAKLYTIPNDKIGSNELAASGTAGSAQSSIRVGLAGTMRLILQVTTTAVSVTQTFAVVLRSRGGIPTGVLADSVGTPTLTTNTSRLF